MPEDEFLDRTLLHLDGRRDRTVSRRSRDALRPAAAAALAEEQGIAEESRAAFEDTFVNLLLLAVDPEELDALFAESFAEPSTCIYSVTGNTLALSPDGEEEDLWRRVDPASVVGFGQEVGALTKDSRERGL